MLRLLGEMLGNGICMQPQSITITNGKGTFLLRDLANATLTKKSGNH